MSASRSSSRASSAWSTAATTRPGSRSSRRDGLDYVRAVGPLGNLKERAGTNGSTATTGLGHTRWATHGGVTEANAHPLAGCEASKLSIVLNGIVENYRELTESLVAEGHTFTSETDAETVTHLIERHYEGDLVEAVRLAFNELEGHFAFVVIHHDHPGLLVGARHQVPLVVGIGERRDVPRVERRCVPARDAHGAVPERRRDRRAATRGRDLPERRRQPGRARADRARLGRRGRREGRLRDVHAQGDLRAARGRRRDDRRPRAPRDARARGPRHVRTRTSRNSAGSSSSPAARRTTRASSGGT